MRVYQERSDQQVWSRSLYSWVLFLVLSLNHYKALHHREILSVIFVHTVWQVISEGEHKTLNAILPLSNMTYHMKKYCNQVISEYLHCALQISHKYTGMFYIIVVSPFSTLIISKLSRKSDILFHTHI